MERDTQVISFKCDRLEAERLRQLARETHRTVSAILRLLVQQAVVREPDIRLELTKERKDGQS